jgi:hypothetical protein
MQIQLMDKIAADESRSTRNDTSLYPLFLLRSVFVYVIVGTRAREAAATES